MNLKIMVVLGFIILGLLPFLDAVRIAFTMSNPLTTQLVNEVLIELVLSIGFLLSSLFLIVVKR